MIGIHRASTRPGSPARALRAWLLACLVSPAIGCGGDDARPGEPGGPCLVGSAPCVEGYACIDSVCARAGSGIDAGAGTTYTASVTFPENRVLADGETPIEFDFFVQTVTPDGDRAPYDVERDGPLFLTPIPATAGRIEPARVSVLIQGLGIAEFVPCQRGVDPLCPESASIRVARDDAPLESIGESEPFTLVDPAPPPADMGLDGGM